MISINALGNVVVNEIKDVAYFKVAVVDKNAPNNPELEVDLNPLDYIENGSKATGVFFLDMATYVVDKFNQMIAQSGKKRLSVDDLRNFNSISSDFDLDYPTFALNSVVATKEFQNQKLQKIDDLLMFFITFVTNRPSVHDYTDFDYYRSYKKIKLDKTPTIKPTDVLNMLYRVYLYSFSSQARTKLIGAGISSVFRNGSCNIYYKCDVNMYDKFIDDVIEYEPYGNYFKANTIYNLSTSNKSTSSTKKESIPVLDIPRINCVCPSLSFLDDNLGSYVFSTRFLKLDMSAQLDTDNIFSINAYTAVEDDCMISVNLSAKYKDLPTNINTFLCSLFDMPMSPRVAFLVANIIDSPAIKLKHNEIVFDKDMDDIISSDNVELSLAYTSYTRAGGARRTEYKDLATRKISPTTRRDALFNACYALMNVANIKNKANAFSKLDVDFKRFYGYVKA